MKTQLLSFDTWTELSDRKQYEIYMLEHQKSQALDDTIEVLMEEHQAEIAKLKGGK